MQVNGQETEQSLPRIEARAARLERSARNANRLRLRRRKRRARDGMTLIEIMVVMVIMALVATAAGFAILPAIRKARIKQTSTDAKAIVSAAELYYSEKDACPSVQDLLSDKILDKSKNTQDAWKHDFAIECDTDGITVRSAGPDGQMGNEDDIQ